MPETGSRADARMRGAGAGDACRAACGGNICFDDDLGERGDRTARRRHRRWQPRRSDFALTANAREPRAPRCLRSSAPADAAGGNILGSSRKSTLLGLGRCRRYRRPAPGQGALSGGGDDVLTGGIDLRRRMASGTKPTKFGVLRRRQQRRPNTLRRASSPTSIILKPTGSSSASPAHNTHVAGDEEFSFIGDQRVHQRRGANCTYVQESLAPLSSKAIPMATGWRTSPSG